MSEDADTTVADAAPTSNPPARTTKGVKAYWNQPLSSLAQVPTDPISPEWAERHRIYSLLTMALVNGYWNGNKRGADGWYPWREAQMVPDSKKVPELQKAPVARYKGDPNFGDRYIGHNIACIAVDENGEVIDFEFNHNEIYNSSAEHAEARLVRRIFNLNNIFDHWQTEAEGTRDRVGYSTTLSASTLYTSLESCAQCSGIMALGNLKRVVYLQTDPGQYFVGNIMYNLTRPYPDATLKMQALADDNYTRPGFIKGKFSAPEPLDASLFGFEYKQRLEAKYLDFAKACGEDKTKPFYVKPGGSPETTDGLTSFLCTDEALSEFAAAAKELDTMSLAHPDFRPKRTDNNDAHFSNREALAHIKMFLSRALRQGNRGTPHR